MPVFISHRTADDTIAKSVHSRLTQDHQIECFIDDFMPDVKADHVTEVITTALQKCTHLLAILTDNTRNSWWVPFEIGYATHCDRAITSYTNLADKDLPEYLWKWPILRGQWAVDQFAAIYKAEKPLLETFINAANERQRLAKEASATFSRHYRSFEPSAFHANLKAKIGQI